MRHLCTCLLRGYLRLLAEVATGSLAPACWLPLGGASGCSGPDGRCIWHRLNALCQTHTSAGLAPAGLAGRIGAPWHVR